MPKIVVLIPSFRRKNLSLQKRPHLHNHLSIPTYIKVIFHKIDVFNNSTSPRQIPPPPRTKTKITFHLVGVASGAPDFDFRGPNYQTADGSHRDRDFTELSLEHQHQFLSATLS